jgi:hypothetical protein
MDVCTSGAIFVWHIALREAVPASRLCKIVVVQTCYPLAARTREELKLRLLLGN